MLRDERPFEQRTDYNELHRRFAITRSDCLVMIVDYAETMYWGGKRVEVCEVSFQAGQQRLGIRWSELDENLTPAFPEDRNWKADALRRRAAAQAAILDAATAPAQAALSTRRM